MDRRMRETNGGITVVTVIIRRRYVAMVIPSTIAMNIYIYINFTSISVPLLSTARPMLGGLTIMGGSVCGGWCSIGVWGGGGCS